jgi:hypothetical protein
MTIAVRRNSHSAFDAADYATHHAAYYRTDWTGISITHSGAVLTALNYALCLRRGLYRKNRNDRKKKANSYDQSVFHGQIPFLQRFSHQRPPLRWVPS